MAFDDKLIAMKLRDAYGLTPEQAMKVVGFIAEENQHAYMEGFNIGFERASRIACPDKVSPKIT